MINAFSYKGTIIDDGRLGSETTGNWLAASDEYHIVFFENISPSSNMFSTILFYYAWVCWFTLSHVK